jgi:hypothetical protein
MPKIDKYRFGTIIIEGKKYYSDLIIGSSKVYDNWWRQDGHKLILNDLKTALGMDPEVMVVGTGFSGMLKIDEEVDIFAKSKNIKLISEKTKEAVKIYNKYFKENANVVGCFHLTC